MSEEHTGPAPNEEGQGNVPPDAGWNGIAEEFGLNFEQVEGVEFQQAEPEPDVQEQSATDEEKLFAAEMMVRAGLSFAVGTLYGLEIPGNRYDDLARSTAALIVKHYKGGVFEFMAQWREEIAFAGAMLAFIGAVREASKVKAAKDVSPKTDSQDKGAADAE